MKNLKSIALMGESLSKFTPYVIAPPSDELGSNLFQWDLDNFDPKNRIILIPTGGRISRWISGRKSSKTLKLVK